MRIQAALHGDLEAIMQAELQAATAGVQRALRRAQALTKGQLRSQVERAGLGRRLAQTWTDKGRRGLLFWPNDGLNAAALVVSKAPQLIEAHTVGGPIRPRRGRYLAIPTPEALRMGRGRRRVSPRTFPGGPQRLRYVHRPQGPDLLVLDTGGQTKTGRYRKGSRTQVMFLLVPQVTLRRRLPDLDGVVARVTRMLPAMILREYR